MVVIWHQRIRVYLDTKSLNGLTNYIEKFYRVIIVNEYAFAISAPVHDMMPCTLVIFSWWSCHSTKLAPKVTFVHA